MKDKLEIIVLDIILHEILAFMAFILPYKHVCIYIPDMSPVYSFKKWMTFYFLYSIATNSIFWVDTKPGKGEKTKRMLL